MIITCINCQTKFKVAPELVKETGSRVRCSNCQSVFTVFRPQNPATPVPIPQARPVQPSPAPTIPKSTPPVPPIEKDLDQLDEELEEELEELFGQTEPQATRPEPGLQARPPRAVEEPQMPSEPDSVSGDLGLSDDPLGPTEDEEHDQFEEKTPPLKTGVPAKSQTKQKIFLLSAIVIAVLIIASVFLTLNTSDSGVALQTTDPVESSPGPDTPSDTPKPVLNENDPNNTLHLNFIQNQQAHNYRENKQAGTILIITGRVSNGYQDRRSFIRIKAILKDNNGGILAERQVFAGNYLEEEELINLPIQEILARLSIRGGHNGQNMNIPPGKSVRFMLVFDKIPQGLAEYVVEPVSSVQQTSTLVEPSSPALPGAP